MASLALWEVYALQQFGEAGVGTQRVEVRIGIKVGEVTVTAPECLFQLSEGLFYVAATCVGSDLH